MIVAYARDNVVMPYQTLTPLPLIWDCIWIVPGTIDPVTLQVIGEFGSLRESIAD